MNFFEQEIFDLVESSINPAYFESAKLVLVSNKSSYNSLIVEAQSSVYRIGYEAKVLFARLKTEGKTTYISFPESQKKYIDGIYNYVKTTSDSFLRISIDEFVNITRHSNEAKEALNSIFISAFNFTSFGCCSRYKECSKEGKCIHPDMIYASACQYKKNIDEGKIFY